MTAPDVLAALTPVVETLERLGVRYLVGGSVASSVLGVARATLDVDLVADLVERHAADFVALLREQYYVSEDAVRSGIRRRASFNLVHLETMLKVDVFVVKDRDFDRESFGRRRRDSLEEGEGGREFFLASAEDTILHKLDWYRQGGGVADRQWRDVLGVLKVQGAALDLRYLDRWADALGLTDLLAQASLEAWDAPSPPPSSPHRGS